jgi:hypothetical protein
MAVGFSGESTQPSTEPDWAWSGRVKAKTKAKQSSRRDDFFMGVLKLKVTCSKNESQSKVAVNSAV